MAKKYYQLIYQNQSPDAFEQPNTVIKIKIDKVLLNQEQKVAIANKNIAKNEVVEEYFSIYNVPKEVSQRNMPSKNYYSNIIDEILFYIKSKRLVG